MQFHPVYVGAAKIYTQSWVFRSGPSAAPDCFFWLAADAGVYVTVLDAVCCCGRSSCRRTSSRCIRDTRLTCMKSVAVLCGPTWTTARGSAAPTASLCPMASSSQSNRGGDSSRAIAVQFVTVQVCGRHMIVQGKNVCIRKGRQGFKR